jgi:hypothetical protein
MDEELDAVVVGSPSQAAARRRKNKSPAKRQASPRR